MNENYKSIIPAYRQKPYAQNCDLIDHILDLNDTDEVFGNIEDVIQMQLDMDIRNLLIAYQSGNVDDLFLALTGWSFETVMAMAKVIPCTDGSTKPYPTEEITFPQWGKDIAAGIEG